MNSEALSVGAVTLKALMIPIVVDLSKLSGRQGGAEGLVTELVGDLCALFPIDILATLNIKATGASENIQH